MNKLKQQVNLIKIIAEETHDIGDDPTSTSTKKPISSTTDIGGDHKTSNNLPANYIKDSNVQDMQKAIQDLAFEVTRDANSKTLGPKPQFVNNQLGSSSLVAAKKGFNDFIAEQYLNNLPADKRGVEWSSNPDITTIPNKKTTTSDPYELDVVMNTIQRIGSGSKEFQADGRWGIRTDNALRNILGFAYALLQLDSDFGLNNKEYSLSLWQTFQRYLSYSIKENKVELSEKDKSKRAKLIIPHLKAITNLYHDFRQKITANPVYRPLIEGNRGYEKYSPVGTSTEELTPEEKQAVNSFQTTVPGLFITLDPSQPNKTLPVPLFALLSKENYFNWIKNQAGSGAVNDTAAINIFNKQISPFVNKL